MGTDATPLVVGGCRLDGVLGRGGMGTVYRATQLSLGREVAVKLVPAVDADEALIARFKREVRTAAALEHPNSIPIYAAGEEEGLLYLVMRLVHGPDLGAIIAAEGALAPDRAVGLVEQIAGALDAAHAAGLVHRDVKPANVLVEPRESGEHAYISDFGLMRRVSGATAITRVGEWVGTVDYVAPEQVEGRPVDLRADVYALTALLYAALAGRPPFPAENPTDTARAHLTAPPPKLPAGAGGVEIAGLNAVITRGMAKQPNSRFASAGALAHAARAALEGIAPAAERPTRRALTPTPPPAPATPPSAPTESPTRVGDRPPANRARRRVTIGVLVIILFSAIAGSIAAYISARSQPSSGTTSSTRTTPAPASQLYRGPAGSFRYPAGWRIVEAERAEGGGAYFRTMLVNAGGTEVIDIDRTPHDPLSPGQKAASVENATAAHTPGYQPVSFSSTTIAGRPGVVWEFMLRGQPRPGRIDIFQKLGGSGYAVYGLADTVNAVAPTALAVARSLTAR